MKKQANILEYVEKYKYKYGISYANEKSNLVKKLYMVIRILLIALTAWILIFDASLLFNAQKESFSLSAINNSAYKNDYYILLGCFALLIVTLILAKKNKLFISIALIILPFAIASFRPATRDGLNYMTTYYLGAVPAYAAILLIVALVIILIRAKFKTNRIYDLLVEGLYKQYGTQNGEKISEEDWQKFLKDYNPKKMFMDIKNTDKNKSKK